MVAVEVVGLLVAFTFFVGPVVYLYQGFVAVGIGVDIGISAVGVVTVVFVAGHQSVGLTVLNHDVIAVGETA